MALWGPAIAGEQKGFYRSRLPRRNRLGEIEPAVVERTAGDHAFDAVCDMRAQRMDIADIGNAEPGIIYADIDTAASAAARKKIPNLKNARDFSVRLAAGNAGLRAAS